MSELEHINICVPDPKATATILVDLFDWHVRWEGPALDSGFTVHVGTERAYVALYAPSVDLAAEAPRYRHVAGLNHIGIVVADLAECERRVRAAGYTPHSHASYEPGSRFYFDGPDGVEYEVVSYQG